MQVVAHRGLQEHAPENSLAAIEAAIAAGFRSIEVDVRASADGDAYLLHDAALNRTTGGFGRISVQGRASLRHVRLADGSPLPRLAEALDLARGRVVLCLDIKSVRCLPALDELSRADRDGVEVWSSHPGVVHAWAGRCARTLSICDGLLSHGIGAFLWRAQRLGATAVSFFPADIEPHVAAACRNAGVPFLSGTPNDEATWAYLEAHGAWGAITDRPRELRDFLAARGKPQPAPVR